MGENQIIERGSHELHPLSYALELEQVKGKGKSENETGPRGRGKKIWYL